MFEQKMSRIVERSEEIDEEMVKRIRSWYLFDGDYPEDHLGDMMEACPGDFWVGENIFFVKRGAKDGLRAIIYISPAREYYVASGSPFAPILVQCDRWAAIQALQKFIGPDVKIKGKILPLSQVPGFNKDGYHEQGWYSKSPFVLTQTAPSWAPEASTWNIQEGIFLSFPDGSFRLVGKYEFFNSYIPTVLARQGDCLVLEGQPTLSRSAMTGESYREALPGFWQGAVEEGQEASLGRHTFRKKESGGVLVHPQHESVEVPPGAYVAFMPGTSRPFSADDDVDGD